MKKVLSVVLAVAMVLGCVASLAFVVGDQGSLGTPTESPLQIEGFYVTDTVAWVEGVQPFTGLTQLTDALYAKNNIVRLAVDLAVLNPNNPSNTGIKSANAEMSTLIFKSDTVDFSLSTSLGSIALYKPAVETITDRTGVIVSGLANIVKGPTRTGDNGIRLDSATGDLEIDVYTFTTDGDFVTPREAAGDSGFERNGVHLYGVSDDLTTVKTEYTLVLTGITTGELDQEGLVTLEREDSAGDTFNGDGEVIVTVNGHTYAITKWYDNSEAYRTTATNPTYTTGSGLYWDNSDPDNDLYDAAGVRSGLLNWTHNMQWDVYKNYTNIYDVNAVGYLVRVLLNANGYTTAEDLKEHGTWGIIGMFETEQVRYGALAGEDLRGTDVENRGISLGFDYYGPEAGQTAESGRRIGWQPVSQNILTVFANTRYYKGDSSETVNEIFKAGINGDHLYGGTSTPGGFVNDTYLDEYMTARDALEQFMADFGFGTGSSYSYKVEDADFEEGATYEQLGKATYNGNAIVVPQPEEDDDVEEGTGEGEIEEDIPPEEDIPDEGEVEEEPTPEPVPETGDASAAVAVALTAAALVAAAGLAVVLKKAR